MAIHRTKAIAARHNPLVECLVAFQATKLYDLVAAAPLITWYSFLLTLQLPMLAHEIDAAHLATADARAYAAVMSKLATQIFFIMVVLLLALRRRPLGRTSGLLARFAAVAGTFLGVAIVQLPTRELSVTLSMMSTSLILFGVVFSLYTVAHLGRSLSMMPEARRLVTSGPYAVLRHPLYVGEAISLLGVTLQYMYPWALVFFTVQCIFQFERMKNEERILSRTFPEYRDYMIRTARLIPGVY